MLMPDLQAKYDADKGFNKLRNGYAKVREAHDAYTKNYKLHDQLQAENSQATREAHEAFAYDNLPLIPVVGGIYRVSRHGFTGTKLVKVTDIVYSGKVDSDKLAWVYAHDVDDSGIDDDEGGSYTLDIFMHSFEPME